MHISTEIVQVTITLADRAPQAANFGRAAVFCDAPYIGGREYELSPEGLSAMVTDGFNATTSRGYELVSDMSAQSPHTDKVLVYNRTAMPTQTLRITPVNLTVGYRYEFDVIYNGVTSAISYTVATGTVDGVCDGLEALIDASLAGLAGITTTPVGGATATALDLIAGTAGKFIQLSGFNPAALTVNDQSTDAGIATDLAAAALAHEFYAFVIDSYSEAENNAAAAWAEANKKLFGAHSGDTTNVTASAGTGVGADFLAAGYHRSAVIGPFNDMHGNGAAGLVARQLSQDPGTSSWAYKDIVGAEPDVLTSTQLANVKGKNMLPFVLSQGARHTMFGKAASGRSFRVTQALDFIEARIEEALLAVKLNAEFVPMSDRGISMLEGAVRSVLSLVEKLGIINPGWTVTSPLAADISTADKVAGLVDSIRFGCVIPGDVLKTKVNGSASL